MKFLTIIFAVITINYYGNSQELKKVTKTLILDLVENYYVFKNDTKIKQGDYSLMRLGDTVRNGFYNNDEKSGIWKYYYLKNNTVEFIFDFDRKMILSDTLGKERPALYSEGHEYFAYHVAMNTKYPLEAAKAGHYGRVLISFTVKSDGSATDFELDLGCGDAALNNEAMRVIKKVAMENTWYPAINAKGEKISSIIIKPVIFMLQ
jgi:TonB family protein